MKEFVQNTISGWTQENYNKSIRVKIDVDPLLLPKLVT